MSTHRLLVIGALVLFVVAALLAFGSVHSTVSAAGLAYAGLAVATLATLVGE